MERNLRAMKSTTDHAAPLTNLNGLVKLRISFLFFYIFRLHVPVSIPEFVKSQKPEIINIFQWNLHLKFIFVGIEYNKTPPLGDNQRSYILSLTEIITFKNPKQRNTNLFWNFPPFLPFTYGHFQTV